jgi:hypothetical protein
MRCFDEYALRSAMEWRERGYMAFGPVDCHRREISGNP